MSSTDIFTVCIEYENPPSSAFYFDSQLDTGQPEDEIRRVFALRHPGGRIRHITRRVPSVYFREG
jgi:hypothetical protein